MTSTIEHEAILSETTPLKSFSQSFGTISNDPLPVLISFVFLIPILIVPILWWIPIQSDYGVKCNTPSCPIHSDFPPLRQSQITKGYKFVVVGFFISAILLHSSHSFQQVSITFHVLFRPNDLFAS